MTLDELFHLEVRSIQPRRFPKISKGGGPGVKKILGFSSLTFPLFFMDGSTYEVMEKGF